MDLICRWMASPGSKEIAFRCESPRFHSVSCSVTASGPLRRPAALGLLLRGERPRWGLGSAQNKFESGGTKHRPNFFRVPPRKQTFGAWESRPLASLRQV